MILADTSVWVDYLRGSPTPGADALDRAIDTGRLVLGDLILAEIMRGLADERQAAKVWSHLRLFEVLTLGGREIALWAGANYRRVRREGTTIRGTVDLMIASWCIVNDVPLIHADRDFQGMQRLGLRAWP